MPHARGLDVLDIQPRAAELHGRARRRASEFAFHTQIRPGEERLRRAARGGRGLCSARRSARELADRGAVRATWNAGYTLVAERFGAARVFVGGDAAHLFTPTGGLGYNTAVEDAVNLGWKLAAVVQGWGGPGLLASVRSGAPAASAAQHGVSRAASPTASAATPRTRRSRTSGPDGDRVRGEAGEHLLDHARREFNIPGVTFGGRYDASPIVIADGAHRRPTSINRYVPSGCPGRASAARVARRRPLALRPLGAGLHAGEPRVSERVRVRRGGPGADDPARAARFVARARGERVARAVRRRPRARPAGPASRLARRRECGCARGARAGDGAGYSSRRSFAAVFPRMSSRSAAGTVSSRCTVPTGSARPMSKQ